MCVCEPYKVGSLPTGTTLSAEASLILQHPDSKICAAAIIFYGPFFTSQIEKAEPNLFFKFERRAVASTLVDSVCRVFNHDIVEQPFSDDVNFISSSFNLC